MAAQLTRSRAIVVGGVVVAFALGWLLGRGLGTGSTRVVTGVVGIVNAFQSKVCITEDGSTEQWCGPLAVSGDPISAGERVTMVISPLRTGAGDDLEFGTVVPSKFGVVP